MNDFDLDFFRLSNLKSIFSSNNKLGQLAHLSCKPFYTHLPLHLLIFWTFRESMENMTFVVINYRCENTLWASNALNKLRQVCIFCKQNFYKRFWWITCQKIMISYFKVSNAQTSNNNVTPINYPGKLMAHV